MQKTIHLAAAQDKLPMYMPLLIKPATYQSQVVCLFLWSLLVLRVWETVSDYNQEEAATQQLARKPMK